MTGKWLSTPAVLWAMDETCDVPPRLRYTLVAVARYADKNGLGAYPAAAEVARITGKSRSQVIRDMTELAKRGYLLPGDPGLVEHIRAGRRPSVYDLPMPRGASGRTSSDASRGASGRTSSDAPRGASDDSTRCMGGQHEVHLDAHRRIPNRSGRSPSSRAPARDPRAPAPAPAREAGLAERESRAILASLGATERETDDIIASVNNNPSIRDPAAYIWTAAPDLIGRLRRGLAAGGQGDGEPPPPPKPPWCGQCDEHSRLRFTETDDHRTIAHKCPECHQDRAGGTGP
jgi:hypothetical protein